MALKYNWAEFLCYCSRCCELNGNYLFSFILHIENIALHVLFLIGQLFKELCGFHLLPIWQNKM